FLAGEHFDLRFGVKKGSGSTRSPTPAAGGALLPCHITGEVSQENERGETVALHAWAYATSPVTTAGSPLMRAGRWSYADRGSTRHPRGRPYPPYPARRIRPCSLDGNPTANICNRPEPAGLCVDRNCSKADAERRPSEAAVCRGPMGTEQIGRA